MNSSVTDHRQQPPRSPEEARALADLIGLDGPVEIAAIGANPIDGEPAYRPLLDAGLAHVIGFEPQPEALARLHELAGPHETYLPTAIGDGGRHTLRVCASDGFSSLLEPDADQLAVLTDFPRLAEVTGRTEVDTTRLDDMAEIARIDLMTMDLQGGEPAVLDGGAHMLRDVVAVQTEMHFHRLYEDGPTFADIDRRLRTLGLVPHQLVTTRTWPMAPVEWADELQERARHLVEADLLYVRDPARLDVLDEGQLRRLALLGHAAYGSCGIALACLTELVGRHGLDADAVQRYRALAAGAA